MWVVSRRLSLVSFYSPSLLSVYLSFDVCVFMCGWVVSFVLTNRRRSKVSYLWGGGGRFSRSVFFAPSTSLSSRKSRTLFKSYLTENHTYPRPLCQEPCRHSPFLPSPSCPFILSYFCRKLTRNRGGRWHTTVRKRGFGRSRCLTPGVSISRVGSPPSRPYSCVWRSDVQATGFYPGPTVSPKERSWFRVGVPH